MPDSKFLDLDAFAAAPGRVQFQGKIHEIPDLPLKEFLATVQIQQDVLEMEDDVESVETIIALIHKVVPTLPKDELELMTLRQLGALLNFIVQDIQGDMPPKNRCRRRTSQRRNAVRHRLSHQ